jgi:DNA-binding GntR family transcriptional regulator
VRPETPVSMAQLAYTSLREKLVMLDISPGEPIDEKWEAARLEVGRTPVREALKRLEADRLVVSYPRRGTFASDVRISDLALIAEVRARLEPFAARCAAERRRPSAAEELARLREEVESQAPATRNPRALVELDKRAHTAVYRAAENPFLEETLLRHFHLATRIWCLFLDRLPDLSEHVEEHAALLSAVLDGDADQAEKLSRLHIVGFEQAIRSVI